MKILVFSDLHISRYGSPQFLQMKDNVDRQKPDLVLISGDVCESSVFNPFYNPFEELETLNVPVVFCLGNHEFAYQKVDDVVKRYSMLQSRAKNVFCLDVIDRFEFKDVCVVGNVLWYDGSLYHGKWDGKIVSNWLDSKIIGFDPRLENKRCVGEIEEALKGMEGKTRILLTHCVPDRLLNAFDVDTPFSVYNAYSGVDKLLDRLNVDFAYCGHTHRPAECRINNIQCFNVGNDILRKQFRFLVNEL